jgi:hypothetical protein
MRIIWTKSGTGNWPNIIFRRVINLLTWTGDIWSGIAEKVTSWAKRSTSSSTWTESETTSAGWTKKTSANDNWTK